MLFDGITFTNTPPGRPVLRCKLKQTTETSGTWATTEGCQKILNFIIPPKEHSGPAILFNPRTRDNTQEISICSHLDETLAELLNLSSETQAHVTLSAQHCLPASWRSRQHPSNSVFSLSSAQALEFSFAGSTGRPA